MNNAFLYILLGVGAGILSGLIGLGGGIIIVPALVFLFHFSQHQAQGTTLAMLLPPIGILAAWAYYRQGYVDLRVAGLLAVGFFVGGFFGAKLATAVSSQTLGKIFGFTLLLVALKMIWGK